jgi:hypothetical protein
VAVDFQVCFPQQSIKITGVSRVPGSDPPTLDVLGEDFSSVDEVLINDIPATNYYVVSRNRLFVVPPVGVPIANVDTVAATSRTLTLSEKSLLKFQISRMPSKVNGILRLVQLFTKVLFTTPGTDAFNQKLGGGALRNIGRTFSRSQTGGIVSDFVVSVDNTTRQLISIQSRQPQLPANEKLLSAKVTSANFSLQEAALLVTVEITSQTGQAALANVVA